MKIVVLMSTYNGEKYIKEQIESLLAQKLPEDGELKILVRDDGSSDSTTNILDEYKLRSALDWYTGKNLKPAKSFWNLVQNAPDADYYAFCDQDDVWFNDKLFRAIDKLNEIANQNQPLLYAGSVYNTSEDLTQINHNVVSAINRTDFPHALLYSLAPGCTMVFNDKARDEFVKYDMNTEFVTIHDWLAHKIVAMTGKVIYDPEPSMYYRQHGNNVIGARKKGLVGSVKRFNGLMKENAGVRSNTAKSLIKVYGNEITDEKKEILEMVAFYKKDRALRIKFLHCKNFSVNKKSDFALKALIRIKKI